MSELPPRPHLDQSMHYEGPWIHVKVESSRSQVPDPGGRGHGHRRRQLAFGDVVLPLCYSPDVPVRKKRSISVPPELDASIEEAARAAGTTYSGWLAATARKELTLRAGLAAVAAYERAEGEFSDEEIAEADAWAQEALARGRRSGARTRRTA